MTTAIIEDEFSVSISFITSSDQAKYTKHEVILILKSLRNDLVGRIQSEDFDISLEAQQEVLRVLIGDHRV